ncbi:hypothetical protein D7V94_20630 [Parablautia intestinalis]|uniref:Uncharacterized protein n=1 Tax=Parablautia intestinalis TaxID=2320100 RepID=A0A3A9A861_9FIRM|nr:hypothetical protein D7V94_20630 [Parablautia intestinalis]
MPGNRKNPKRPHAGNGEDGFQSGKPGLSPLKEGATIHHPKGGALRPAGSPLQGAEDFRRFSICSNPQQGKLHFPCAGCRQLPLCVLAARKHLALQAVPGQQVL